MRPSAEARNHPLVVFPERVECGTSRDIQNVLTLTYKTIENTLRQLFIAAEVQRR